MRSWISQFLLLVSLFTGAMVPAQAALSSNELSFFHDSELRPMIGLSCSSELDCLSRCGGSSQCQRPVSTCMNCVGARVPELIDLFDKVGDLTTSCASYGSLFNVNDLTLTLFNTVEMIPILPLSPYNPLGLKDLNLVLKFMSLCPVGTFDPAIIAFTDRKTHKILDIPMVKCGNNLFPLVSHFEECSEKARQITSFAYNASVKQKALDQDYQKAIALGDQLPLYFDLIQLSEYSEARYLRCDSSSRAVCQQLCHSGFSCTLPLVNTSNQEAISAFNKEKWSLCPVERFSLATLERYIGEGNSPSVSLPTPVAFSYASLLQTYDPPQGTKGTDSKSYADLSIINSILKNFSGVFQKTAQGSDAFLVSDAYREKLRTQMKTLCDDLSDPIILGRSTGAADDANDLIERVLCQSEKNRYFRILVHPGESCEKKKERISGPSFGPMLMRGTSS